jgi:hypothetical protein
MVHPECGDASACLKKRIPVIRRGHSLLLQLACQIGKAVISAGIAASDGAKGVCRRPDQVTRCALQ